MMPATTEIPIFWYFRCAATLKPLTESVTIYPCGHEINESLIKTAKTVTETLKKCPVVGCPHAIERYEANPSRSLAVRKYIQCYPKIQSYLSYQFPLIGFFPGEPGTFRGAGWVLQSHNGSLINMIFLSKRENYALVLGLKGQGDEICHFFAANGIAYKKFQPNGSDFYLEIEEVSAMRKAIHIMSHFNNLPDGYAEYLLSLISEG